MRFELLVLFFAYLKSSSDIYKKLREIVEQKKKTKDYFLLDLKKKYYVMKTYITNDKITFTRCVKGLSESKNGYYKFDRVEYNTADEAIQKICDYYLSSGFSQLQGFEVFCTLKFCVSKKDIKLNLENFFYYGIESDFFANIYDSNKQKQIRELCSCFSRNRMIDFYSCFLLSKDSSGETIHCFKEENKIKIFFPVKLRNLIFFLKLTLAIYIL